MSRRSAASGGSDLSTGIIPASVDPSEGRRVDAQTFDTRRSLGRIAEEAVLSVLDALSLHRMARGVFIVLAAVLVEVAEMIALPFEGGFSWEGSRVGEVYTVMR